MTKIKILVVDDSFFMRKVLSDIINENTNFEVIGTAKNGQEALKLIKVLKPDVVTMDIEMPIMDGLTALKIIMEDNSVPVLMLSGLTKDGADATIKALNLGAVDFIPKPGNVFKVNVDDMKEEIYNKITVATKISIVSKDNNDLKVSKDLQKEIEDKSIILQRPRVKRRSIRRINIKNKVTSIVAIGTSTGGPRALQSLISELPANLNAPIVVVQHMPPSFTKSLAERLDSISKLNVKEAEEGDVLTNGCVYIAPGGNHLILDYINGDYLIHIDDGPKVSGHKPSVDVMMSSLSKLDKVRLAGVILTGMGSDGASGLYELKGKQGYVIAQNEESCVVFGMPKSAINRGVVDTVLPLSEISKEIIDFVEVG